MSLGRGLLLLDMAFATAGKTTLSLIKAVAKDRIHLLRLVVVAVPVEVVEYAVTLWQKQKKRIGIDGMRDFVLFLFLIFIDISTF